MADMRETVMSAASGCGIQCAYGWYEQGNEPTRPYAVLNPPVETTFYADNAPWYTTLSWSLALVTDLSDEESARLMRSALGDAGILFGSFAAANEEDGYMQTTFTFESLGDDHGSNQ